MLVDSIKASENIVCLLDTMNKCGAHFEAMHILGGYTWGRFKRVVDWQQLSFEEVRMTDNL